MGLRSENRNHDDSKHSEVAPPRPAFLFGLSQSDKRHAARASNKAAPRTTGPTCTSTHDPVKLAYRPNSWISKSWPSWPPKPSLDMSGPRASRADVVERAWQNFTDFEVTPNRNPDPGLWPPSGQSMSWGGWMRSPSPERRTPPPSSQPAASNLGASRTDPPGAPAPWHAVTRWPNRPGVAVALMPRSGVNACD